MRSIYQGSFDPVTRGHLDVVERASKFSDELIVAVAKSDQKHPLFSLAERIDLMTQAVAGLSNVRVVGFEGLLVDLFRETEADVVIRGLRAVSDFEFEFQMALMNRSLDPELETIFVTPKEEFTFVSSRIVKEIARLGGDISSFVPEVVSQCLKSRLLP